MSAFEIPVEEMRTRAAEREKSDNNLKKAKNQFFICLAIFAAVVSVGFIPATNFLAESHPSIKQAVFQPTPEIKKS